MRLSIGFIKKSQKIRPKNYVPTNNLGENVTKILFFLFKSLIYESACRYKAISVALRTLFTQLLFENFPENTFLSNTERKALRKLGIAIALIVGHILYKIKRRKLYACVYIVKLDLNNCIFIAE